MSGTARDGSNRGSGKVDAVKSAVPFGKYLLIDRVNVGGMAEVYKAKTRGVEGFEKLVAIKRILPNIAEDDEFITMFIDEAKISVQLTHANIAQIYDLGKIGDSYFIAMEYVPGKDLRAIFDRMRKRGETLPIPLTCYAISRVCEGLDYAHRKKDAVGRDLNIVHRDISPQNVLTSFEGEVKLIDFGIAKAANKASKTQAGILKGKFGYMSPEQVRGLPLDRRSDIFAVGVVLYELLTGERLFLGESDFSTLEKVRNVDVVPPSTYNRRIPDELERIVMKALTKDVDQRYQWCSELENDLQRFLITSDTIFSRKDLATFMKAAFAEDLEREKLKNQEAMGVDVAAAVSAAPPVEEISFDVDDDVDPDSTEVGPMPTSDPSITSPGPGPGTQPGVAPPAGRTPPPAPPAAPQPPPGATPLTPPPAARTPAPPAAAPVSPPAAGPGSRLPPIVRGPGPGAGPPRMGPGAGAAPPRRPPLPPIPLEDGPTGVGAQPQRARDRDRDRNRDDDDRRAGGGGARKALYAVGGLLLLAAVGGGAWYLGHAGPNGAAPGVLIIRGSPTGAKVSVDGAEVGDVPYIDSKMTVGEHQVKVVAAGYRPYQKQVAVLPGQTATVTATLKEASHPKASVLVVTVPLDTEVLLDGKVVKDGGQSPWQSKSVAAGTSHTIVVHKPGFRDRTFTWTPEAGSDKTFTAQLASAQVTVVVDSTPSHAEVFLDGDKKGETPLTLKDVDATEKHALKITHAGCYQDYTSTLLIEDGLSTKTVDATLDKKPGCGEHHAEVVRHPHPRHHPRAAAAPVGNGTLRLNTKPGWASVWVDGKNTGRQTPLLGYQLPAGTHRVTLKAPNGKRKELQVTIRPDKVTTKIVTMD